MNIQDIDNRIKILNAKIKNIRNDIGNEKRELEFLISNKQTVLNAVSKLDNMDNDTEIEKEEYLKYREKVSDIKYFDRVKKIITKIPDSNGSRFYSKFNINVGIIADEFLYQSYKDVANFYPITNKNYKEYQHKLDILLVVTAWKGLDRKWVGLANPKSNRRKEVYQIIDFYKKNNVKTVFYSKEDPVNYDKFIGIAQKCDYIFTTAEEKIADYKKDCKNNNVFTLEFGINPLYHNPIGIRSVQKSDDVFFAGSWLTKYPERQKETIEIFDGVIESNRKLKIIDRNFNINHPDYFFPKKYLKYISPAIEHQYLQKIHKLYNWAINLNSVKYSSTMFANRIYELQAIGNIILSNYSVGVNDKFPNVFIVNNKGEVKDILNSFDSEEVYKHQVLGIRNVMTSYTTFERFDYLLECIGLERKLRPKKVLVVADVINDHVKSNFESQTYQYKQLISEDEFSEEIKSKYDIIAFFNSGYTYEEFYLQDMVNGFKYTDSDYIAKNSYYNGKELIEGQEHVYINEIKDKYKTVFWSNSFNANELINMGKNEQRENGYCIDHFELNTSDVKNEVLNSNTYKLSVIVPVYNNGKYLLNKCFNSLKRSSVFSDMEIILVDDGSTDKETLMTIKRLDREYQNVITYFFNDGGSGSASRPRNKGIELATTEFITYLDPDNEAVNDGYAKLLKLFEKDENLDIAIGNMIKLDNKKQSNFIYYKTVMEQNHNNVINDTRQLLIDSNLRAQSIQALIVKKNIIVKNNLKMVENAGGQDTLFFQQLMLSSKKAKVINEVIHIYYAAVSNSVTNTITKKFFKKFYTLEKERLPFLIENNLLNVYMERRFNFYFKNWYLVRIKQIQKEDWKESIDTVYKIYTMYEKYIKKPDKDIERFVNLYKKGDYSNIVDYFS